MIERHKHRIGYQAWQLCAGNAAMREDLKQEAWLACLEYLERHPERNTVPTVRIRGAMIDHLRKVLGRGNNTSSTTSKRAPAWHVPNGRTSPSQPSAHGSRAS